MYSDAPAENTDEVNPENIDATAIAPKSRGSSSRARTMDDKMDVI